MRDCAARVLRGSRQVLAGWDLLEGRLLVTLERPSVGGTRAVYPFCGEIAIGRFELYIL